MLNISKISISKYIDRTQYKSYKKLGKRTNSKVLNRIMFVTLIITIASMFLPWTQNIRSRGYVSTLNPYDKPQNIQALIGGQIQKWYVIEGDTVSIGDTIVILTEAKADYLDPQILQNTKEQQNAKIESAKAYEIKRNFLKDQMIALRNNQASKLDQIEIKQEQLNLEEQTLNLELEAAKTYELNATNQLQRMESMYSKGIKSLTDLETKKLSLREASAKVLSVTNKLNKLENDRNNLDQQVVIVNSDTEEKLAKIESEIKSSDSYIFSLQGETSKLQSKYNQIAQRQGSFVITSPINGKINKVLKNGIGEYVKPQESIATIVPTNYQKAVELYITPNDMPLIKKGKKVRMQFDGWPAIVFSGWPNNSFGTFGGEVFTIDNEISDNGKYRILVVEDDSEKSWPDLIRIGSGVQGLLLLNDVRIYYEIWRQLNGFPPDFYTGDQEKKIKRKAPLKKIK